VKKISKSLFLLGILFAFACTASAQSISGTASALLITPLTIVKNLDLNFGNLAVSSTTGGTVILSTSSTRTTGGSGGVTLPAITGTVSSADFTVSGQGGYTYSITLPTSVTITDGLGHSMTISSFTSFPSTNGTLSSGGTQDLTVGATLSASASQVSGAYTSASGVPVTVNYN
jgi:hypothetical protein